MHWILFDMHICVFHEGAAMYIQANCLPVMQLIIM